MNTGKKITIFLSDGLPKGIREVKIDQWSGKCLCGPLNRLKDIVELLEGLSNGICVYFLIGDSGHQFLPMVYIGQTDSFQQRIKSHGAEKNWCKDVVIFFSSDGSLTRTGAQYLESVCVQKQQKAGRSFMGNGNIPKTPIVPREDASGLEMFFENISLIMPLLGYDIFVQSKEELDKTLQHLFCRGKGVKAEGVMFKDGKIKVLKGSEAVLKDVASFESHFYFSLKKDLLEKGRLVKQKDKLIFSDDYVFDSPSAAAAIILARPASGPSEWKDKKGKTLKEISDPV